MAKQPRRKIAVPLDDEDISWLEAQADADGLEIPDYLRMMVRRARRGIVPREIAVQRPPEDHPVRALEIDDERGFDPGGSLTAREPEELPSGEISQPSASVDDIVAARLAEAESKGLTEKHPTPERNDGQRFYDDTGVLPLSRPQLPAYGNSSPRISRHAAGT